MSTFLVAIILFGVAAFGKFPAVLLLNIAGLPGALIAGVSEPPAGFRRLLGILICAIGQAYVYLAYVAMVVGWTSRYTQDSAISAWVLWPLALLAALLPVQASLFEAKKEADETGRSNVQVEALYFTTFFSLVGFILFVFVPVIAKSGWFWVPYVG